MKNSRTALVDAKHGRNLKKWLIEPKGTEITQKVGALLMKKIIKIKKHESLIKLLEGACFGIGMIDFEKKIGFDKEDAISILKKIKKACEESAKEIAVEENEVLIIKNIFKEVKKEIEDWEFGVRIGAELDEIERMPVLNDELPEKTVVELYQNLPIINILSEICYDSPISDFETKLGVKEKDAQALLDRLLDEVEKEVNEIYLEDWEVDLIKNAFAEVKKTIPAEEFSKRIGMKISEVEALPIFKETR